VSAVLVTPGELAGTEVAITGETYRHLFRAARLAVGDPVRLVDGEGHARLGRVARVERKVGILALGEPAPSREPERHLEILVASPRPQRAAWLVEKVTEVGASAVRFLATERSARDFGAGQIERLLRVARSAVEQCGRSRVPAVTGTHPFAELPELLAALPARFVLDPEASPEPGRRAVERGAMALLVGPEGGWTGGELKALAGLDGRPLGLGARTLRVETACVVGCALLLLS